MATRPSQSFGGMTGSSILWKCHKRVLNYDLMVVRILLKLWLLVRERNKEDNSNLVNVVAYLDTGKYPSWIYGYLTHLASWKANLAVVLGKVLIGLVGHRMVFAGIVGSVEDALLPQVLELMLGITALRPAKMLIHGF
jgi:hypothetical protein